MRESKNNNTRYFRYLYIIYYIVVYIYSSILHDFSSDAYAKYCDTDVSIRKRLQKDTCLTSIALSWEAKHLSWVIDHSCQPENTTITSREYFQKVGDL